MGLFQERLVEEILQFLSKGSSHSSGNERRRNLRPPCLGLPWLPSLRREMLRLGPPGASDQACLQGASLLFLLLTRLLFPGADGGHPVLLCQQRGKACGGTWTPGGAAALTVLELSSGAVQASQLKSLLTPLGTSAQEVSCPCVVPSPSLSLPPPNVHKHTCVDRMP